MRVTILGRSPARPNPGEACAGYLVEGGGTRVLLDAGPGVVAQLLLTCSPDELDAVLISHMHTDHFLDLVTLRYAFPWLDEAKRRLTVIVPPGSKDQLADLARGAGYPDFFARSFDFVEHDGERAIELGNLRFEPHATQHYVPTWGFRTTASGAGEEAGRVFAYSADTAPYDDLGALVDGADLLLCEAALRSLNEDARPPEPRGHLLPSEAGEIATRGRVGRLVLTHLPVLDHDGWAREQAATAYEGPVEVAEVLKAYDV